MLQNGYLRSKELIFQQNFLAEKGASLHEKYYVLLLMQNILSNNEVNISSNN